MSRFLKLSTQLTNTSSRWGRGKWASLGSGEEQEKHMQEKQTKIKGILTMTSCGRGICETGDVDQKPWLRHFNTFQCWEVKQRLECRCNLGESCLSFEKVCVGLNVAPACPRMMGDGGWMMLAYSEVCPHLNAWVSCLLLNWWNILSCILNLLSFVLRFCGFTLKKCGRKTDLW